jgi:hypothetical protein
MHRKLAGITGVCTFILALGLAAFAAAQAPANATGNWELTTTVVVQPEMERGRFPLVSNPPLRGKVIVAPPRPSVSNFRSRDLASCRW